MAHTNPIALLFAFLLMVVVIKLLLGKTDYFKKNPSYVLPIIIAAGIFVFVYLPLLKVISLSVPLIALVFLFLVGLGCLFYM
ncbi:TPA: hypothetical protein HA265_00645, partial [Candidatus Woesearchaeota archaeon]|nr:hypothetical protein [Candidatus Woesearchaeota archaeon]